MLIHTGIFEPIARNSNPNGTYDIWYGIALKMEPLVVVIFYHSLLDI